MLQRDYLWNIFLSFYMCHIKKSKNLCAHIESLTSVKKGFDPLILVPKQFKPELKETLIPIRYAHIR
jgi:hypothetical protein